MIIADACQCGCGGFDQLLLACLSLPELEYLDCSGNDEEQIVPALTRLIKEHKTLKTIIMENCELLSADDELDIVRAIKEAAVDQYLNIEDYRGIDLSEPRFSSILELSDEIISGQENSQILQHLKDYHCSVLLK